MKISALILLNVFRTEYPQVLIASLKSQNYDIVYYTTEFNTRLSS